MRRSILATGAGISLIEVLVGLTLLVVGAFATIAMQRGSIRENDTVENRAVATALARQLLEAIERVPYDPAAGSTYAGCLGTTGGSFVDPCAALSPANPLNALGANQAGAPFTRRIRISNAGGGTETTANYKTIQVRVTWSQAGTSQSVALATIRGWTL
jgi:Tfp pilus assembly protein PilV